MSYALQTSEIKRVAILYSHLSGYSLGCLKELKKRYGIELLVFQWEPTDAAPFDFSNLHWIDHLYSREEYSVSQIAKIVRDFSPQGIYITGWMDSGYLKVARGLKKKGIPVIAGLDNQWDGRLRQRLGSYASLFHSQKSFDVLWVAGERQARFAKELGYTGAKCWYGVYCCDWEQFAPVSIDQISARANGDREKSFLYVGRYASEKGIQELLAAFRLYRAMVESPWTLRCAGAGDLKHLFNDQEGVIDLGFVQPKDLPSLMREAATAFVLPSRQEPWGVVLQEAAASGLPLICSDACGASVHLLQDGYNGFLFESGNATHLANCMVKVANMSEDVRVQMGIRSYELSKQFTPQRWADTLVNGLKNFY